MKFAFIARNVGRFPVNWMCRRLEVSSSGFYAWRRRGESERAVKDRQLKVRVREFHEASGGTYGSPRIHRDLAADGTRVGRKRVARLMREEGLQGHRRRRFKQTTTVNPKAPAAPNLLQQQFTASAPNVAWVGDISTWERGRVGCSWRSSSTCIHVGWLATQWLTTCGPSLRSRLWRQR